MATTRQIEPLTDAQRALVEQHIGWAIRGAAKTHSRYRGRHDLEDLVSAAYFGLVQAARKFDPARGFSFKTYAMPWTECYMRDLNRSALRAAGGVRAMDGSVTPVLSRDAWPTFDDGTAVEFPAPAVDLDGAIARAQLLARVLALTRTDDERVIVLGRLEGVSFQALGVRIGKSRSWAEALFRAFVARARRALGPDEVAA